MANRSGIKRFSSPMPEILVVVDNDYEQRYYRSPAQAARGIWGWLTRPSQHNNFAGGDVVFYRKIDIVDDLKNKQVVDELWREVSRLEREWDAGIDAAAPPIQKKWIKAAWDRIQTIVEGIK